MLALFEGLIKALRRHLKPSYKAWLEKQREYGKIGGIKSGEVRRLKTIEKELDKALEEYVLTQYPEIAICKILGVDLDPKLLIEILRKPRKEKNKN